MSNILSDHTKIVNPEHSQDKLRRDAKVPQADNAISINGDVSPNGYISADDTTNQTSVKHFLDPRMQALLDRLHLGSPWRFLQNLSAADENGKKIRKSIWFRAGEPMHIPNDWFKSSLTNLYFGVSGSTERREPYQASIERQIAAVNCFYGDFDGKDQTFPTEEEIDPVFATLYSEAVLAGHNTPNLENSLRKKAFELVQIQKYLSNPEHYKALALAQLRKAPLKPSAMWMTGGGYQAVWLLDRTVKITDENREQIKSMYRRWVTLIGADPLFDLRRILRVVGFPNQKPYYAPNFPMPEFIDYDLKLTYRLDDIEIQLPPEPVEEPRSVKHENKDELRLKELGDRTVIQAINEDMVIEDMLAARGCTYSSRGRMSHPGNKVSDDIELTKDNQAFIYSTSNPVYNDRNATLHKPASCFDVILYADCNGNMNAAIEVAKKHFGIWTEPKMKKVKDAKLQKAPKALPAPATTCADRREIEPVGLVVEPVLNGTNGTNGNGHHEPVPAKAKTTDPVKTTKPEPVVAPVDPDAEHLTDLGNGKRMARLHSNDLRNTEAHGWLVYDGKRWERDATKEVHRIAKAVALSFYDDAEKFLDLAQIASGKMAKAANVGDEHAYAEAVAEQKKWLMAAQKIQKWAKKTEDNGKLKAMIEMASSELPIATRAKAFDQNVWFLNLQNGTIDLRTGKITPHERENLITKLTPVTYDAAATCPTWLKFLDRIFDKNQELIDFIRRSIGFSLTGKTTEHHLFFAYGGGKNGKSTFFNTVTKLLGLGEYFIKCPTDTLMAKDKGSGIPNDVARMAGARFVLAAEVEEGSRLAESKIKDLTGGDVLPARFLHKEFFDFVPSHKLWMYGNHKPIIRGTDMGIWRRILLIPFLITIPAGEHDPNLEEKLGKELSGIFNWALTGCLEWQESGLNPPTCVLDATNEYKEEMDVLSVFFADCTTAELNNGIKPTCGATDLYKAYKIWAESSGQSPVSQTRFGSQLRERGIEKVIDKHTTRTNYIGVGLLSYIEDKQGGPRNGYTRQYFE